MVLYKVVIEGSGYLTIPGGEKNEESTYLNGKIRSYATLELEDKVKGESIEGCQFVICDENLEPMTSVQIIKAEEVK